MDINDDRNKLFDKTLKLFRIGKLNFELNELNHVNLRKVMINIFINKY